MARPVDVLLWRILCDVLPASRALRVGRRATDCGDGARGDDYAQRCGGQLVVWRNPHGVLWACECGCLFAGLL